MEDALDEPYDGHREMSSLDDEDDDLEARLVINMQEQPRHEDTTQYDDNISDEINTAMLTTDFTSLHKHLPMELDAMTHMNRLHFLSSGEDYDESVLKQSTRAATKERQQPDLFSTSVPIWLEESNNSQQYSSEQEDTRHKTTGQNRGNEERKLKQDVQYLKSHKSEISAFAEEDIDVVKPCSKQEIKEGLFAEEEYTFPSLEESLL